MLFLFLCFLFSFLFLLPSLSFLHFLISCFPFQGVQSLLSRFLSFHFLFSLVCLAFPRLSLLSTLLFSFPELPDPIFPFVFLPSFLTFFYSTFSLLFSLSSFFIVALTFPFAYLDGPVFPSAFPFLCFLIHFPFCILSSVLSFPLSFFLCPSNLYFPIFFLFFYFPHLLTP